MKSRPRLPPIQGFRKRRRFRIADSAQQIVGGFLLAGPFVVTEEVWLLAAGMNLWQAFATIGIVCAIGYAALYKADTKRDPSEEQDIVGIPVRFLSLVCIAFGSVLVLALLFDAPDTFLLDNGATTAETAIITFKAVSVGAVFSVVGAATADSVF
ncbi:DUF2391 family protein [Natronocalculus amylovorans]|uniref:DUF2391 family protein n=1 Tax=Natronocalculus amylovorans TaxID=2917812 RepID=A0AAE3K7I6_9EURY|nr:DUF2391 family protein [Natronocalculus amylovorans]MCL9816056.1 DUF2391 family protein [Natronocalculus amylovorans]